MAGRWHIICTSCKRKANQTDQGSVMSHLVLDNTQWLSELIVWEIHCVLRNSHDSRRSGQEEKKIKHVKERYTIQDQGSIISIFCGITSNDCLLGNTIFFTISWFLSRKIWQLWSCIQQGCYGRRLWFLLQLTSRQRAYIFQTVYAVFQFPLLSSQYIPSIIFTIKCFQQL